MLLLYFVLCQAIGARLVDHVADVDAGDVDAHHADLFRALDHVDELVHRRVAPQRDLQ